MDRYTAIICHVYADNIAYSDTDRYFDKIFNTYAYPDSYADLFSDSYTD